MSFQKLKKKSTKSPEPKKSDSATNILEKFFDYSSKQSSLNKLFKMDRYNSKGSSIDKLTSKETLAGSRDTIASGSNQTLKGVASSLQGVGGSSVKISGSAAGSVGSVGSAGSGGDPPKDDSNKTGSVYSLVDDSHPNPDDGTEKDPIYVYRLSHDQYSTKKKRGCRCCRKKRPTRGYEEGDTALLQMATASAIQVPRYEFTEDDFGNYPIELQQALGIEPTTTTTTDPETGNRAPSEHIPAAEVSRTFPPKILNRRTRIPNRPNVSMSLWGILKNAIGKDLTKLPLPVNFNEPLSMLQRLAEDYEYSGLLDRAANASDPYEQIAYVAAFTVSSYASTAVRTGKPFNPLLGETFESDRMDDLGFRCFCEQVSHHPPTAAQHCTGRNWILWQEFTMSSSFRGNYLQVTPLGIAHLVFKNSGNHYTWRKVSTIVHNLILGRLWIDNVGEMDIYNHSTGDVCHLNYIAASSFGGEQKRVEGTIYNKDKQPQMTVAGYWDRKMELFDIVNIKGNNKFTLGPPKTIWTRNMPPPESEKYYNFTVMACQLNEMEDGVAPTDSRRRPDQRLMENGRFDEANAEKLRLEEKQRAKRKKRMQEIAQKTIVPKAATSSDPDNDDPVDEGEPGFQPAWFTLQNDPMTGKPIHIFNGEYWTCKEQQDWSRCPDIY